MELAKAKLNSWYSINKIEHNEETAVLESRLMAHGFIPGEKIMVKRMAPIFKDPILVQIGNSQLALTKSEARLIHVNSLD